MAGSTCTKVTSCHNEIGLDEPVLSTALIRYSNVFSSPWESRARLDWDPWEEARLRERVMDSPRGTCVSWPNMIAVPRDVGYVVSFWIDSQ